MIPSFPPMPAVTSDRSGFPPSALSKTLHARESGSGGP